MPRLRASLALWLIVTAAATALAQGRAAYEWTLPHNFPQPRVPATNPMSRAKVELGRYLFYDTRLSGNGTYACSTCHEQDKAFTDGKPQAVGSTGEHHARGAMSLVNIAYAGSLTWANPEMTALEEQALVPMFGEHPVELGLKMPAAATLAALRKASEYQRLFPAAFPGDKDPFTIENVARAVSSFERTIISADSPYDRYHYDRDDTAVTPDVKRGEQLFFSQPLSCFRCHGGFTFSGGIDFEGRRPGEGEGGVEMHNTGLYNLAGPLSYPAIDGGLYQITKLPADVGKFKAPTLRNVAVTAPYMHDGSIATLSDVLDHYAAGGRSLTGGPNSGVGHDNPNKSPLIRGFPLSAGQKADLLAFLNALTDTTLLHDPRFANPRTH